MGRNALRRAHVYLGEGAVATLTGLLKSAGSVPLSKKLMLRDQLRSVKRSGGGCCSHALTMLESLQAAQDILWVCVLP